MACTKSAYLEMQELSHAVRRAFSKYYQNAEMELLSYSSQRTNETKHAENGYLLVTAGFKAWFVKWTRDQGKEYHGIVLLTHGTQAAYSRLNMLVPHPEWSKDRLEVRSETCIGLKMALPHIAKAAHDVSSIISKHTEKMHKDLDALVREHKQNK